MTDDCYSVTLLLAIVLLLLLTIVLLLLLLPLLLLLSNGAFYSISSFARRDYNPTVKGDAHADVKSLSRGESERE